MDELIKVVRNNLENSTQKITAKIDRLEELNKIAQSGRYTQKALVQEVYPERDRLRREIQDDAEAARRAARKLVTAYQDRLRDEDNLDPAQITDDIKLFTAGIPLLSRDINAILARNSANRTMTQITLRYAKEHDIDIGRVYYIGNEEKISQAEQVSSVIDMYCDRWISKPGGGEMLDKFFTTGG